MFAYSVGPEFGGVVHEEVEFDGEHIGKVVLLLHERLDISGAVIGEAYALASFDGDRFGISAQEVPAKRELAQLFVLEGVFEENVVAGDEVALGVSGLRLLFGLGRSCSCRFWRGTRGLVSRLLCSAVGAELAGVAALSALFAGPTGRGFGRRLLCAAVGTELTGIARLSAFLAGPGGTGLLGGGLFSLRFGLLFTVEDAVQGLVDGFVNLALDPVVYLVVN